MMNQSGEIDQPYKGQKFTSFEHLKKYLEEYGQKNYVKFWIRSSHTRNSQKSKISKTMNPDLKYVSVKFACIFGGEKIRCRGSGIRKSYTYRNLGCPCMINAVVGEDGNHVKLDTVILEHNHALCKTLYDSLKKTKRKYQPNKNQKEVNECDVKISVEEQAKSGNYLSEMENLNYKRDWLESNEDILNNFKNVNVTLEDKSQSNENCLKDIEDKYGKIVKILVINSENQNSILQKESVNNQLDMETVNFCDKEESLQSVSKICDRSSGCDSTGVRLKKLYVSEANLELNKMKWKIQIIICRGEVTERPEICRLCLSSNDKLSPIFNPNLPLESTVLSFKIMGCASIEINCNDGLPNNICTTCEANLDIAYNFRIRCEKSDSILRETYTKSKTFYRKEVSKKDSEDENSNKETFFPETTIVYPEDQNEETAESFRPTDISSQVPSYFQFAISCPMCGIDFDAYEFMLEHLGTHTDDETFLLACNICTLVCPSVKDLQEHIGEHLQRSESEIWTCGVCDENFATAEELKTHEISHESDTRAKKPISEVKYLCNVCGKIFKTKDRFQAHKNMHEGLRPHVCLQCGRGFADRKNLHQHYDVVHLRKVRHECPVCQRKFYTRTKMKSHMTMHSGDKPFTCDVCNKSFRLKMNMNKHKKTHTNDRPYQCDKCSAAFIEKNLLKRHSYKHGGIRPFRCPVCNHGFSAKFCLKKHLKDSKCRGVVIADPDSYQWLGMGEPEMNLDDGKCVVVYKADEGTALQRKAEAIDLNILQE